MKAYHVVGQAPMYTNTFLLISEAGHGVVIDPAAAAADYGHRLGGLRRGEVFVQDLFVVDVGQLERELPGLEERAHLDLFVGGGAALFALGQRGKDEAVIKKRLDACEHRVTLLMVKIWIPFQYSTFRPLCRAVKKL